MAYTHRDAEHKMHPPTGKWINIYIEPKKGNTINGILKARYLNGPNGYEGWYVKENSKAPGRIYPQNVLNVYSYTFDEEDYDQWYEFHSLKDEATKEE